MHIWIIKKTWNLPQVQMFNSYNNICTYVPTCKLYILVYVY